MAVLLITNDRSKWQSLDEVFGNDPNRYPTVWIANDVRGAANYLHCLQDIDMVFMGFYLDRNRRENSGDKPNTISSGLVEDFVRAGYGKGQRCKPLIACTSNRNKELLLAGCSHQTSLTLSSIEEVLTEVGYTFLSHMLRAG